jgi:hypothetical protein
MSISIGSKQGDPLNAPISRHAMPRHSRCAILTCSHPRCTVHSLTLPLPMLGIPWMLPLMDPGSICHCCCPPLSCFCRRDCASSLRPVSLSLCVCVELVCARARASQLGIDQLTQSASTSGQAWLEAASS